MKFRGYETFSLRKGWLHKGISEILADNRIFYHKDTTAMDNLGIGSNMVKLTRGGVRELLISLYKKI